MGNDESNALDASADDDSIRQGQNISLRVPLNYQLPKEIPASLTEEQIAPLRDFLQFWRPRRHSPALEQQKLCNVTLQVEVELALERQLAILPESDLKQCKIFLESLI